MVSHEEEVLPPMILNQRRGTRVQEPVLGKAKTKEPVPKAADLLSQKPSEAASKKKNYVADNRNKAIFELKPPAPHESPSQDKHKNFGKVPN